MIGIRRRMIVIAALGTAVIAVPSSAFFFGGFGLPSLFGWGGSGGGGYVSSSSTGGASTSTGGATTSSGGTTSGGAGTSNGGTSSGGTTDVPEPGMLGLFGLGAVGLIVARRASRRRKPVA